MRLTAPDATAGGVLAPHVAGEIHRSHDGLHLRAPVRSGAGLATTVVRALDAAGISVDDVAVHQPSLDDVFFSLTGHPADTSTNGAEARPEPRAVPTTSPQEASRP